ASCRSCRGRPGPEDRSARSSICRPCPGAEPLRVAKPHTSTPESRWQAPCRGRQASLSFTELLSLFFGCLTLCVTDRGLLQVSLQRQLAADSVVHVVEREDGDVEQRIGAGCAAARGVLDHPVPCLLRFGKVLEPALGHAEGHMGGVVVRPLLDDRG